MKKRDEISISVERVSNTNESLTIFIIFIYIVGLVDKRIVSKKDSECDWSTFQSFGRAGHAGTCVAGASWQCTDHLGF